VTGVAGPGPWRELPLHAVATVEGCICLLVDARLGDAAVFAAT
jgi:hypothetical protein